VKQADERLVSILRQSPIISEALELCFEYGLAECYIAGGAVTQTVWNWQSQKPIIENIKDIDIVYFCSTSGSEEEAEHARALNTLSKTPLTYDVKNQALVHKWYPEKFGKSINAYKSAEEGIESWLPAFSVGVRQINETETDIFAPFGLDDMFNKIIRPNKKVISETQYASMCNNYLRRWPDLEVASWKDI
jgi:hypothetical protein